MGFIQDKSAPVYVAGHRGMVGSALVRNLKSSGYGRIVTRTRSELDLRDKDLVRKFFQAEQPQYVFLAAAKVGGIKANADDKAGFLLENLEIQNNVIGLAAEYGVKKLLFLGSSCIYPKLAPQPISENSLLTSPLEETNEGYAIAKIAGLKLCSYLKKERGLDFISAMPTNLYGIGDNFHPQNSHVIPGLLRKFHEGKKSNAPHVEIWGSGTPRREFLYADDCAAALVYLMGNYSSDQTINVGVGEDLTILELATLVSKAVGFKGEIRTNTKYPDGTPRKLLDCSRIHTLGWRARTGLEEGIKLTYEWAIQNGAL